MRGLLRYLGLSLVLTIFLSFVFTSYLLSNTKSHYFTLANVPTVAELDKAENVSTSISNRTRKVAIDSRNSSVLVVTLDYTNGNLSVASGTYITYNGKYFIMTAAHAISRGVVSIVTENGVVRSKKIVYISKEHDYGFFEVDEISDRIPIDIMKRVPSAKQWEKRLEVLDTTIYTGYPNSTGPLTVEGKIMGFAENVFFMNTYGWSGASGSGVFSEEGDLIGIISALEVGQFMGLPEPLQNSVIVKPTYLVDWAIVFEDY